MVKKAKVRRANSKKVDTCKQATSLILSYLTGELDPLTKQSFESHLLECPDCVSFLNTYKKTAQFTRSLRYEDMPYEMKKRIRQFLKEKG
jgi:anti-sigma factor RsiW